MKTDNIDKLFKLIAIGFASAGLCLLIAAWFTYQSTRTFLSSAVPAKGTITSNYKSTNSNGEASFYPVVQFRAMSGEVVEFRSSSGSGASKYAVGSEVDVLYALDEPVNAKIRTFTALWLGTIIFTVLGLGFSAVGTAGFVIFRK